MWESVCLKVTTVIWISLRCHWFSYIYVGILSILSHHWFLIACEHMFQMREGRKKNWQMWFLRVEKRCLFYFYALSKILNTSKDKSIASTMHFITTKIWALAEPSKVSVLFAVFWTFLRTFDFPESASWSSKHVFLVLPHRQLQDQVLWLWQVQKYKNEKNAKHAHLASLARSRSSSLIAVELRPFSTCSRSFSS